MALVPDLGREVVGGFWGADGGKGFFPVMVIGRDMMAFSQVLHKLSLAIRIGVCNRR